MTWKHTILFISSVCIIKIFPYQFQKLLSGIIPLLSVSDIGPEMYSQSSFCHFHNLLANAWRVKKLRNVIGKKVNYFCKSLWNPVDLLHSECKTIAWVRWLKEVFKRWKWRQIKSLLVISIHLEVTSKVSCWIDQPLWKKYSALITLSL